MAPLAEIVLGTWAVPEAPVARAVLVAGVLLALGAMVPRVRAAFVRAVYESPTKRFVWVVGLGAALLSLLYVHQVLRGGPRIIDATTYLLEARTFADGHATFDAGFPSAGTRGRFLVYDAATNRLAGLFPPGYPLVLALFVAIGQPLLLGPLLGAALALLTWRLGRRVAESLGEPPTTAERVGRTAALFSLVCAVLRYHTADTMAHGLSALYVTVALSFAIEARSRPGPLAPLVVGLALGGLAATRPVSMIAPALASLWLLVPERAQAARGPLWRSLALVLAGAGPGLFVLFAFHHAVTGSAFGSPQRVYYATSDGPPGCFGYGFGAGIGCLYEHGEFVRHNLPSGYGLVAALGTTGRRLKMHLADAGNFEPFVVLVASGAWRGRGARPVAAIAATIVLQILAYAPFYFDGNYPGGGARFYADVLPLEHVLVAVALLRLGHAAQVAERAQVALAVALVSLGVHTSHDHRALANREDGVPFFLPDALAREGIDRGLLFVETDHAFALAHEPTTNPASGVRAVRLRGDDHDWLLFEALGRPPTYRYRATASPEVAPFAPSVPEDQTLRFEAEAEWPPLAQDGGYAIPVWRSPEASGGRVLLLTPTAAVAHATIAVPALADEDVDVVARVSGSPGARGKVRLAGAEASFDGSGALVDLPPLRVRLPRGESHLVLEANGGPVALDRVMLSPAAGEIRGTSSP